MALTGPRRDAMRRYFADRLGALAAGCRHRRDAEGALEVGVTWPGAGGLDAPGGLVAARAGPGPGRQVPGGGEPGHVRAGLGDDHVGDAGADPGDRDDHVPDHLKGPDHYLDPGSHLLYRAGVMAGQVQVHAGQEGVMLGEPAGQGLAELRDFRAQPPPGQGRQGCRVALPAGQRLEHRPPGHPGDISGHRGQLDPGSSSSFSSR